MSRRIATVTAVYSTQCYHEPQYRYRHCCVEYIVPPWAAVSLPSLMCTAFTAFMSRSIAIVTGVYSTQYHHEPQDFYRHCCVQYSVPSWAAVSLTSLLSTVLSAIICRNIATFTVLYSTQWYHGPQYRYRHWCVQYSVPSWAAISLPSMVCTVLSAIMSSNIANVTGVYSTQWHYEPQYRYRHCGVQHLVP